MQTRISEFLIEHRISQASIARVLELDEAAISRRVAGTIAWRLPEMLDLVAYFSGLLKRTVSLDDAFGPLPAAEPLVAPALDPDPAA